MKRLVRVYFPELRMCADSAKNGHTVKTTRLVRRGGYPSVTLMLIVSAFLLGFATNAPVSPVTPAVHAAVVDHEGAAFRVLVFSKTLGFRHANIPLGVEAIRPLGEENRFTVEA